jgi:hypothetical protein
LGKKVIAGKLRQTGVTVEIHDDHFPKNAQDENWISEVGKRGWVVPTKNDRIRYRPAALAAYRRHWVKVFVFGSGEIKVQEMADAFVAALPKIFRWAMGRPGPFFARISRRGGVSPLS